jgi:hypothetical protein
MLVSWFDVLEEEKPAEGEHADTNHEEVKRIS